MSRLRAVAFWLWDFFVGDDWITALGVVVAIGVTALVASTGTVAWWIMPAAVIALLALSVRRAAR